eukprot:362306-Chlamydomonas_euryale.AAC.2
MLSQRRWPNAARGAARRASAWPIKRAPVAWRRKPVGTVSRARLPACHPGAGVRHGCERKATLGDGRG